MPQLKEPSWHRDAHSALYQELSDRRRDEINLSLPARRAKARNERKAARAAKRLVDSAAGSVGRTRVRHRSASR